MQTLLARLLTCSWCLEDRAGNWLLWIVDGAVLSQIRISDKLDMHLCGNTPVTCSLAETKPPLVSFALALGHLPDLWIFESQIPAILQKYILNIGRIVMSFMKALASVAVGFAAAKGMEKYKQMGGMAGLQDMMQGARGGALAWINWARWQNSSGCRGVPVGCKR
ncbi:hypothetical protein [Ruegeria sp. Alg231-54]|uniref:hypothetical protein n=1 Tax=Ruegeria sp. Alg231-54 TaxID=1922221 RepID=UPI00131F2449|nr:hypothetical protein [Ruegeria sp. Alg231-54]